MNQYFLPQYKTSHTANSRSFDVNRGHSTFTIKGTLENIWLFIIYQSINIEAASSDVCNIK